MFRGKDVIDSHSRLIVYVSFTALCAIGIAVMFFFGRVRETSQEDTEQIISTEPDENESSR